MVQCSGRLLRLVYTLFSLFAERKELRREKLCRFGTVAATWRAHEKCVIDSSEFTSCNHTTATIYAKYVCLVDSNAHKSNWSLSSLCVSDIISIGGAHIKSPKPLPPAIKAFLDGAQHGVIYFSFGSIVKSSQLPKQLIQAFFSEFSHSFYDFKFISMGIGNYNWLKKFQVHLSSSSSACFGNMRINH